MTDPALVQLEVVVREILAENEELRRALAKQQKPQGEREERVAEWLRERGYIVIRPLEENGND